MNSKKESHESWKEELFKLYPYNIAYAIFCDERALGICVNFVESALEEMLTPREGEILRLRFRDGFTLQKCGEVCGVRPERIRQIQARALRYLRHPSRIKLIQAVPMAKLAETAKEYNSLADKYALLVKAFENAYNVSPTPEYMASVSETIALCEKPLMELELSVRSYNCLWHMGKIKTLGDIVKMSTDELLAVRNLGKKSAQEIIDCVHGYGLKMSNEK